MDERIDVKNKLDREQLQVLLGKLVDQHIITPRISSLIFQKIKQRQKQLSKKEVLSLIETINEKTHHCFPQNKRTDHYHHKTTQTIDDQTTEKNSSHYVASADKTIQSLQKLDQELACIEEKIENIEEIQQHFFQRNTQKKNENNHLFSPENIQKQDDMTPLQGIKNTPENVVILMKWLQYLSDKLGQKYLSDILDYYVNIEWISEDVRLDLIKYAKGISFGKNNVENEKNTPVFTIDDHLQSFMFIQKLKGTTVHDDFLLKINSKLEKMSKNTNNAITAL